MPILALRHLLYPFGTGASFAVPHLRHPLRHQQRGEVQQLAVGLQRPLRLLRLHRPGRISGQL